MFIGFIQKAKMRVATEAIDSVYMGVYCLSYILKLKNFQVDDEHDVMH